MFTPETHKKPNQFKKHKHHGKPHRDKKQTVAQAPEDYKPSTVYLREENQESSLTLDQKYEQVENNDIYSVVDETVKLMDNLDMMFKLSSQLPKIKHFNPNEVFDLKVLKFGDKVYTTNLLNPKLFPHLMDDAPYTEQQLHDVCSGISLIANWLTNDSITLEKINYKKVYSEISEYSQVIRKELNNKAYFSIHHEFIEKDGKIVRVFYLVYSRKNIYTKEYNHIAVRLFSLSSVKL